MIVVFIIPLQVLYAILLDILWLVYHFSSLVIIRKITTIVSLTIC